MGGFNREPNHPNDARRPRTAIEGSKIPRRHNFSNFKLTVAADIFMGAALNADADPTSAAARITCAFTMVAVLLLLWMV